MDELQQMGYRGGEPLPQDYPYYKCWMCRWCHRDQFSGKPLEAERAFCTYPDVFEFVYANDYVSDIECDWFDGGD